MNLDQLTVDRAADALEADPILTANGDLEGALRPIVDSASARGIEDLKVVIVDSTPDQITAMRNFANEVVARDGGTVIVRSPNSVATSSDQLSRAALETAEYQMMDQTSGYPDGFDAFIGEAGSYTVPFLNYSLAAGGLIVAVFAVLIAVWWVRSHRG